jgi:murein DD-endopeptidase MepM/ murein hydrolase activator NlpD
METIIDKCLNIIFYFGFLILTSSISKTEYITLIQNKEVIKYKTVEKNYPHVLPLDSMYQPRNRLFGYQMHPILKVKKMHTGIDIAAPKGSPIYSVGNGFVVKVEYKVKGYGKCIYVKHNKEITSLYAHCSKVNVRVGDFVNAGEKIGEVGTTGMSTGNHLHFEIIHANKKINPQTYLYNR